MVRGGMWGLVLRLKNMIGAQLQISRQLYLAQSLPGHKEKHVQGTCIRRCAGSKINK